MIDPTASEPLQAVARVSTASLPAVAVLGGSSLKAVLGQRIAFPVPWAFLDGASSVSAAAADPTSVLAAHVGVPWLHDAK